MQTQDIRFPSNGQEGMGFLAHPDGDKPVPGIVVIQEWWGLDGHIRDIVRRFADAGFAALAPDLYHGVVTTEPDEARKEAMNMDRARAMKEIDGAVAYLKSHPAVMPKQIGVVGFCMGGGLTLHTGAHNRDVGALAAFYGSPPGVEAFAGSSPAMLLIVGDQDGVLSGMQALEQGLTDTNYPHPHQLVVYPDAPHAFFNDTRAHIYKADAAEDAWKRTLEWFRTHLVA